MSLVDNGGGLSAADVAAVTGSRNDSMFGGDGAWWLLVLLFALNGNWGGFGNGGTQADVQRGFDQSAVMSSLNGITGAISNGFATAEVSRCNANTNTLQSINSLAMGLQNCCCENRAATADLKYTIANEAATTRAANAANTQAILDKLCQQELDALKTQNANLQTQLNMANLAASQTAQTARILQDNAAQTLALEQYLNPVPVPAYVVKNPNCCAQNYFGGCGVTA